jgi:hypothetical protein
VRFPIPKGLFRPGMPHASAVLRAPFFLYDRKGVDFTAHTRAAETRPVAKDKQRDLRLAHAAIATRAVPQEGGHQKHVDQPSQLDLALAMGLKCVESGCRLIGHQGQEITAEQRAAMSARSKAMWARRRGDAPAKRPTPARRKRKGKSFIKVWPGKGRNRYEWEEFLEKQKHTYARSCFQAASPAELAKVPAHAELFDDSASKVNFISFAEITHHPLSPLTASQRTVYDFIFSDLYIYNGATKRWKSGRVQKTQEFIGSKLGMHRDAVRAALRAMADEWTDREGETHRGLGLLKYVGKPGAYVLKGKAMPKGTTRDQAQKVGAVWQQDEPNEYIGICDWAETEREYYERLMEPVRAARPEMAKLMDRIYGETMRQWLEEDKQSKTFQRECRASMEGAGVESWQLDIVFPSRPPPG